MKLLKKAIFINVLSAGLFIASPLSAADTPTDTPKDMKWETFTSKENGFSVDVPTQPEHIHQEITIPQTDLKIAYDTYISEPSEHIVYVISVWNYPHEIDMSQPDVNLQDGFGGMLSALPDSEVVDMQMTKKDGFNVLTFKVKNDDVIFEGKLMLVHNTLYQVFAVYKSSEDVKQDFSRFIDSFKLVSPEKRKIPASETYKAKV